MQYTRGTIVFDGWNIERLIGEGAYGKVFEIRKTEFGITTTSALKVISIPQSQSEIKNAYNDGMDEQSVTTYFKGVVDEIVKEILIMLKVKSHPNVVSYEDHKVIEHQGEIGWDILIRMEYLTPLIDFQMKNRLSELDIVNLGIEIASALAFCHSKGLIHRDVKLENIFVNEAGIFKIGDFGVAKTMDATTAGMSKKGTEVYMAPEVYLGKTYDASADLYSLGLVLYRLLNGNRLPFLPLAPKPIRFEDKENALLRRMRGEIIPAPINSSSKLSEIILKACAYDSENRYKTSKEFAASLQTIKNELSEDNHVDDSRLNSSAPIKMDVVDYGSDLSEEEKTVGIWYDNKQSNLERKELDVKEEVTQQQSDMEEKENLQENTDDFEKRIGIKEKSKKPFVFIGIGILLAVIIVIIIICNRKNQSEIEDEKNVTSQLGEMANNSNNEDDLKEQNETENKNNFESLVDTISKDDTSNKDDEQIQAEENVEESADNSVKEERIEIWVEDEDGNKTELSDEQVKKIQKVVDWYEDAMVVYEQKDYANMTVDEICNKIIDEDKNFFIKYRPMEGYRVLENTESSYDESIDVSVYAPNNRVRFIYALDHDISDDDISDEVDLIVNDWVYADVDLGGKISSLYKKLNITKKDRTFYSKYYKVHIGNYVYHLTELENVDFSVTKYKEKRQDKPLNSISVLEGGAWSPYHDSDRIVQINVELYNYKMKK